MFDKIKKLIENKRIVILGFGKEGRSTLSFLNDFTNPKEIAVADENDVSDTLDSNVVCIHGKGYMDELSDYDLIIKSPGVVYGEKYSDLVEKTTSQTDLFLLEFRKKTVGITGTKGKSTTTTLIYHVLKENGFDAVLTGNIGIPPLESARVMSDTSVAVFEMSCHQLEYQKTAPHVAVLLNLFEDHLDHYKTRENYVKAKENIFLHQQKDDVFVVSSDCSKQIQKAPSRVITVGECLSDYELCGSAIKHGDKKLDIPIQTALIGSHNKFNVTVAKAVSDVFSVSDTAFISALKSYAPLPHRLEYFTTKAGVDYYDDSISTIGETTIQALVSLENVQTVLIGGMDRGINYIPLIEHLASNPPENIILMYESGKRIAKMLQEKHVPYVFVSDLEEGVEKAYELADKGTKCVLSPAAASYGYFKNFEHRGDVFKSLVNKLKG